MPSDPDPQPDPSLSAALLPVLRRQAGLEIRELAHTLRAESMDRLWRFVDRLTRQLSEADVMDVMVEEFLLELRADRVSYVVAEENASGGWTFAASHEAAEQGVHRLPLPYLIAPASSDDYHRFLADALRRTDPVARTWPNAVKIESEPHFETELREEFQAALEAEFGLARFVSCRSAMACAVETGKGGRALFCAQRVRQLAPWTRFERELFREMCRYAASMLEQTQLAEQVRDLTDQFSSLIESMPSAIIGMDLLGTVAMWNGKAQEIFGLTEDQALGRVLWELLPEFSFVDDGLRRILQMDPGASLEFDLRPYRSRDGKQYFLRASLFTLFGSDRGEVALRLDDVTHAEELRQKLSLSQRRELQASLLAAAAQELQNLLTAAQGRIWLAQEALGAEAGEAPRAEIGALRAVADRAAAALQRLLALSGEVPTENGTACFDLGDAAREAVELCRKVLGPGVSLLLRTDGAPAPVRASRVQVEQAVLNLILHARAGLRQGGVLVLQLERAADSDAAAPRTWLHLRVEARGGDSAAVVEPAATSLGWTVACALAEQCGGLGFEAASSEGRYFRLSFPAADSTTLQATPSAPPAAGKGRILVVQSDAPLRETALRLLQHLGYEPTGCPDGASAVRELEQAAFDAALVDWELPVLNGRDTVSVLRAMRPEIKAVFVGIPAKAPRQGLPVDTVTLPRFHGVGDLAAALQAALTRSPASAVPT